MKFSDWDVLPYRPCSPLDLLCANEGCSFKEFPNVFGVCTGTPVRFLVHAADNGFWLHPESFVDKVLEQEYGITLEGDFLDKLVTAIMKIKTCDELHALGC